MEVVFLLVVELVLLYALQPHSFQAEGAARVELFIVEGIEAHPIDWLRLVQLLLGTKEGHA